MSFTSNNAIQAAQKLARDTADYINSRPDEAQNWSRLEREDDIPEFDYIALREQFGELATEIEQAYRDAFNASFKPISG